MVMKMEDKPGTRIIDSNFMVSMDFLTDAIGHKHQTVIFKYLLIEIGIRPHLSHGLE